MSPPRTSPGRSRQQGAKVGATRSGSNGSPRSPRTPRSSCSPFRTGAAPASALPRVGAHGREKRGLDESGQGNGANRGAMRRAMQTLGDMVREEAAEDEREKRRHFGKSGLPTWGQVKSHAAATARRTRGGGREGRGRRRMSRNNCAQPSGRFSAPFAVLRRRVAARGRERLRRFADVNE